MSKNRIADAKQYLSESAFDFLERSVNEIKAEPKYSVIHFAIAVELILKARLMHEHWSLVVERVSEADRDSFLRGNCKSIGLADAVQRLRRICSQNISKGAESQFKKLAAHRNRMIHFFHEVDAKEAPPKLMEEIVKEQCHCWFHLNNLLTQWRDQFVAFDAHIARISYVLRSNRSFLAVAFDQLKPKIEEDKRNGMTFHICSGCGYEAAEGNALSQVLFEQSCRCCGLSEGYAEIECPAECGTKVRVFAKHGSNRTCPKCEHELTTSDLDVVLDTEYVDPTATDFNTSMNCALCVSFGSVVQHHEIYVCTECLENSSEIAGCDWCGELQMGGGDLEASYYFGCEFCDGKAG